MFPQLTTIPQPSLAEEFAEFAFCEVNKDVKCDLPDYLEPNEGAPEAIKPHLSLSKKGVVTVVTGAERGFFHILFSQCELFVFRDINPRAKLYVDGVLLLGLLAETVEEFAELSRPIQNEAEFVGRVELIKKKTLTLDINEKPKNYYLANLLAITSIYLKAPKQWRTEEVVSSLYFSKCSYYNNKDQFLRLQKLAKAGNIIATIGDINDLTFLKSREVAIVDVSNIPDYCMLDLKGGGDFHPRVVWTTLCLGPSLSAGSTSYRSYIHNAIQEKEKQEIDTLLLGIERSLYLTTPSDKISWLQKHIAKFEDPLLNSSAGPFYSPETLNRLRQFNSSSQSWIPLYSSEFF
jgi:hypothetical protein